MAGTTRRSSALLRRLARRAPRRLRQAVRRWSRRAPRPVRAALRRVAGAPAADPGRPVEGRVTAIRSAAIRGWAHAPGTDEPVTVALCVDGTPVNETVATQPVKRHQDRNGGHVGFRFGMERIWGHLAAGQELSVRAAGDPLPVVLGREPEVVDHLTGEPIPVEADGYAVRVQRDGSCVDAPLLDQVAAGRLINKKGRLQTPTDRSADWAARAMPEYQRIERLLVEHLGERPYVFYGAMLGFAREGGLMAHDLDLDLAYLSDQTDPAAVRDEFAELCRKVIAQHPVAKPFSYKLQFPGRRISLTPTWFTDGVFHSTFGYVGEGATLERSDIVPLRAAEHDGTRLWLPNRPDRVARYLYGPGWEHPDRGWAWREHYLSWPEVVAARLTDEQVEELTSLRRAARREQRATTSPRKPPVQ